MGQTLRSVMNLLRVLIITLVLAEADVLAQASDLSTDDLAATVRKTAWRSSQLRGRPEPPLPYRAKLAFPHIKFDQPVTITSAPHTNRLFVVQLDGKILSFPNNPSGDAVDLFCDLKSSIPTMGDAYGMTFHPDFPNTPFFYVCCILPDEQACAIVRFTVDHFEPPRVDPTSQRIVFRWKSAGHNGCSLKFGPDGYLYISTGDGSGASPPDALRAGQDLSNVLSCILRIDVDHANHGQNYSVPKDNPFIGTKGARPEIWAYGFRNPWKISFDRATGDLWTGDVGWETWELVYRVQRGGNYGWSISEGSQPVHPTDQRGPTPILPPVTQHDHAEARSITGGFVYRGKKQKALVGAYIYGDYSTGKIWALRYDGAQVTSRIELADTPFQIVGWGETNAGELFFLDHERTNQVYQLVPNDVDDQSNQFPTLLSETGIFSSVKDHTPAAGVIPYTINAPYWADNTRAERLLALPGTERITDNLEGGWRFPEGTVITRTVFADNITPACCLETQILHLENKTWRPYTYVWNDSQDDATLAPAGGMDLPFDHWGRNALKAKSLDQPSQTEPIEQVWHVASRAECKMCHTMKLNSVLGLNFPQIKQTQDGSDWPESQWHQWHRLGVISGPLYKIGISSKTLVNPSDETADLSQRARSYLHANCAHCHRPGGGGTSTMQLDYELPLGSTKTVNQVPALGTFGLRDGKIIVPGVPFRSVLFYRFAKSGSGRMPHVGSTTIDKHGLRLIYDWIAERTDERSKQDACRDEDARIACQVTSLHDMAAKESRLGLIRQLLADPHGAIALAWELRSDHLPQNVREEVIHECTVWADPNVRDLFEIFLPVSARNKRLGASLRLSEILGLVGDIQRGRQIYWHRAGLQCKSCHQIQGLGGDFGPDLSQIGKTVQRGPMLESLVNPSSKIAAEFIAHIVVTQAGLVHQGLLHEKSAEAIVLETAANTLVRIPKRQIDEISRAKQSLMPEQLLRELNAQEAADLLEYLISLK
ncbi:MAG: PQQ-dependent sugar dehydrogenase [Pirellulales bacterium]